MDLTEAHECVSVSAVCVCIYMCVCVHDCNGTPLFVDSTCQHQHRHQHHARPRGSDPVSISLKLACLLPFMSYSHSFACPPRTMYRTDLPSVNRATGTHYEP